MAIRETAVTLLKFERPHDKTNKMVCVPSEDSDQLGHLPSLCSALNDLSLRWAQRSFCWFCHEAVHLWFTHSKDADVMANSVDPDHGVRSVCQKTWDHYGYMVLGFHCAPVHPLHMWGIMGSVFSCQITKSLTVVLSAPCGPQMYRTELGLVDQVSR